jgi:hypothetical protein
VLQRRLNGLHRHDAGGAMQHHGAHRAPGTDGIQPAALWPARRVQRPGRVGFAQVR